MRNIFRAISACSAFNRVSEAYGESCPCLDSVQMFHGKHRLKLVSFRR